MADEAIGPYFDAGAQLHMADKYDVDVDEHVAADFHLSAYVDARGIRQRRAGEHQLF